MIDTHTDTLLDATWLAADDQIVKWIRRTGRCFEPVTTAWMLSVMSERDGAYVDVGASTGWFAVPMAKRGYPVIAVECNARAADRLEENCALNGAKLVLHRAAASDHAGTAVFTHNPRLSLTSGGSLEHVRANKARELVPCLVLDDVITAPVALLKIDVEGHEPAVLRGAALLIAKHRPEIVMEANTPAHESVLQAWCRANRYTWTRADERNLLCSPVS